MLWNVKKINTVRRNDVLQGLNELSTQILQKIYIILGQQYEIVCSSNATISEMHLYLKQQSRSTLREDEQLQYNNVINNRRAAAQVVDCVLRTAEKFCLYIIVISARALGR